MIMGNGRSTMPEFYMKQMSEGLLVGRNMACSKMEKINMTGVYGATRTVALDRTSMVGKKHARTCRMC